MKRFITKKTVLFLIIASIPFFSNNIYSLSASAKSQADYVFTLELLRNIKIMVDNFPNDEAQNQGQGKDQTQQTAQENASIKKKYDEIQVKFQKAGETYYGQNFTDSYNQFRNVKLELILLMEIINKNYLKRTKEILDSISKESFDVLIQYSKNSGLATYFRKPHDPLYDNKPYNQKNYHFFHDKQRIETYLKNGYKKYQQALNLYNDPEIKILKKKKSLPSKNLNYIIEKYIGVVFLCREAKQYGIEIYKIGIKNYELDEPIKKVEKPIRFGEAVEPIRDDRIPDKFKIDANDNMLLIHTVEKQKISNVKPGSK